MSIQVAGGLGQSIRLAVQQRQRRAFRGEQLSSGTADSGRRARDHDTTAP